MNTCGDDGVGWAAADPKVALGSGVTSVSSLSKAHVTRSVVSQGSSNTGRFWVKGRMAATCRRASTEQRGGSKVIVTVAETMGRFSVKESRAICSAVTPDSKGGVKATGSGAPMNTRRSSRCRTTSIA